MENKSSKERLKIICEIDELPEGQFLEFNLVMLQDGWFSRIFKNWKKITYIPAPIKKLQVIKRK